MTDYTIFNEADRDRVAGLVSSLDPSKKWAVTVKKYVKKRTNPQNNLYWKWLEIIGRETGYDKDDLHDALRDKFLDPVEREVLGELRHFRQSTTKLTTQQMTEYMDNIYRFSTSDLGILLPVPEDQAA